VIRHVADGLSNKAIAQALFISEGKVKFHLRNAFDKLQAHNRAELVRKATAAQLI